MLASDSGTGTHLRGPRSFDASHSLQSQTGHAKQIGGPTPSLTTHSKRSICLEEYPQPPSKRRAAGQPNLLRFSSTKELGPSLNLPPARSEPVICIFDRLICFPCAALDDAVHLLSTINRGGVSARVSPLGGPSLKQKSPPHERIDRRKMVKIERTSILAKAPRAIAGSGRSGSWSFSRASVQHISLLLVRWFFETLF